jgi:deoxyribonuclease-4
MPIGFHTSIAGGHHKAVERTVLLGCDAVQIFGRNPRSWAFKGLDRKEAELFRAKRQDAGLWPVAVHTTYLINLSSPDHTLYKRSLGLFKRELGIAEALSADYLVTHLGSSRGTGPEAAFGKVSKALESVAGSGLGEKTTILFENSAGGGDSFGCRLDEIGRAVEYADSVGLKTGLCFDTCHAFASGYGFSTPEEAVKLARMIKKDVGIERLKLIHLNDSKGGFSSRVDRHDHIGMGNIGLKGFKALFGRNEFKGVPVILETPKNDPGDDLKNLKKARRLVKG